MKRMMNLLSGLSIILLMSASTADPGYKVGDYARDFDLKSVDGSSVSLSGYQDAKGFMVIFTCNTCPYAKMYEERIIALHNDYASKGFPVIAINPNDVGKSPGDSFAEMKTRAKNKGFTFPYALDETQEITRAYGATRTPHVYVLKKEGKDKYKVVYIGAIDNNWKDPDAANEKYVRKAVDAILTGRAVPTTSTKAIGCTIKWQDA